MSQYYRVCNRLTNDSFTKIEGTLVVSDFLETIYFNMDEQLNAKIFAGECKYIRDIQAERKRKVKDIQQLEWFLGMARVQGDCPAEVEIYQSNINVLQARCDEITSILGSD